MLLLVNGVTGIIAYESHISHLPEALRKLVKNSWLCRVSDRNEKSQVWYSNEWTGYPFKQMFCAWFIGRILLFLCVRIYFNPIDLAWTVLTVTFAGCFKFSKHFKLLVKTMSLHGLNYKLSIFLPFVSLILTSSWVLWMVF